MAAEPKQFAQADGLGLLMHLPLHLTVELGSAKMSVAELLKLGAGSVVELDRTVDHPIDLLVNGRPIARGEIVAVEERFALRITELVALGGT
jgi:flagellar motor switch protein FliN